MKKEKEIKEALLKGNYVTKEEIDLAEDFAKQNGSSFLDYLFSKNLISKDLLGQAVAESLGVLYADLNSIIPNIEQIKKIPQGIARKSRIVLFKEEDDEVVITSDNPREVDEALLAEMFAGKNVVMAYSLAEDVDAILRNYEKPLETRFSKIIKKGERVVPELLGEIFNDAFAYNASDIHFEPKEEHALVRFRIDGALQVAGSIPRDFYENILNRIKVESNLRIDEHLAPQDGSLRHQYKGRSIDFRTSIIPTVQGEKVVLRMLSAYSRGFSLTDLGFAPEQEMMITEAAKKPFGMIVVCGPTGSGKTTTLYGLLKIVNTPDVNITTIEDPVEYRMAGINQTQVNEKSKLTFSRGLRSIVRQDPDIILVGEIRDRETAEIAVNAALTGHLLYSTFHANDAATTIPRFLDMGVEPFLLSSTLEVVVAQRLVRKICEECRFSITKKKKDLEADLRPYFNEEEVTLYEGKGCGVCNYTGYKGRTGIFEIIKVTPAMQDLILKSPSAKEVGELSKKEGGESMFDDGVRKVKTGSTTLEELLRVVKL